MGHFVSGLLGLFSWGLVCFGRTATLGLFFHLLLDGLFLRGGGGKLAVLVFKIKDATAIATSAIRLEVTACTKNGETVMWKITNGEIKITGFDRGDVNKDGKLDGEDAVALLRHLNTTEPLPDTSMCDVNHDGKINIQDVICLVNHLNGTAPFEPEDTTQEHE